MNPSSGTLNATCLPKGGGEMGSLTRAFDWSKTSVGTPESWPQSLVLTLSMILSSRFPMFLWWGEDLVQFYNDAYRPSFGNDGKHPQALGQKGKECWPEIWDVIYPLIKQVRTSGEATWSEDQLIPIYRNGHLEDVYWTFGYSPIFGSDQSVEGVLVVCNETTEKVQSRQIIENNEQSFRNMILQAPVAMCMLLGPSHIIEVANQTMINLWGKTEDVLNEPIFEALPEATHQGLEQLLDHVFATGEPFKANERPVSLLRNGKIETTYLNFVYEPYRDAEGTIIGILATAVDVSDQVKARHKVEKNETELIEIKNRLELELEAGKQLQQQKDDFIGIASHELKTPLTVLKSSIHLLSRWGDEDSCAEKIKNLIRVSNLNINKLNHLLEELLNDTKINEGQLLINKAPFKVQEIINECCSQVSAAGKNKITVRGDLRLEVNADRQRIDQVLLNLVNNAIKYAPNSQEIEINIERDAGNALVSVTDFGPGVAAEKLPHLFKRYYRVDTSGIQYSGLGLGLFISSEIIRRHGGEIGVRSEVDKGSTFWFSIPLGFADSKV